MNNASKITYTATTSNGRTFKRTTNKAPFTFACVVIAKSNVNPKWEWKDISFHRSKIEAETRLALFQKDKEQWPDYTVAEVVAVAVA